MTQLSITIALLAGLAFGQPTDVDSRYYAVAGAPHIADAQAVSVESKESSVANTTPINWLPFARP